MHIAVVGALVRDLSKDIVVGGMLDLHRLFIFQVGGRHFERKQGCANCTWRSAGARADGVNLLYRTQYMAGQ